MKKEDLRIVYMGTPEFAVEPLKQLVNNGYNVVGAVTMPDKLAGRGLHVQFSPVKEYALSWQIPVLQPESLKSETFLTELKALRADLQIVVAFRMLPEAVWNMPPQGTFNLHASLLPQYRGAAPINWAIINGEKETGVTTFFITHEIDTGKIIQQEKILIGKSDDAGTIHDQLMYKGTELVLKTVDAILTGNIKAKPQEDLYASQDVLKPAPKIFKNNCQINFAQPALSVYNFIRGLSPHPTAWAEMTDPNGTIIPVKIFETEIVDMMPTFAPGFIRTDGKKTMDVATTDGYIRLKTIQMPGKKRLAIEDFLRGFKMTENFRFIWRQADCP